MCVCECVRECVREHLRLSVDEWVLVVEFLPTTTGNKHVFANTYGFSGLTSV